MIKVILVEDEPVALRHLKSIIERKCSGFEIIDTAENGQEGLEKIKILKPDIVITDIKMPIMDGIELISRLRVENPNIRSIIVSGYQDFEYARSAVEYGVKNYILKPINTLQIQTTLNSLKENIELEYRQKQIQLLKQVIWGGDADHGEIVKYLKGENYSVGVLRENGLPSRFQSYKNTARNPAIDIFNLYSQQYSDEVWVLPGRDDMELILICNNGQPDYKVLENFVKTYFYNTSGNYYTFILATKLSMLSEIGKTLAGLCKALDNKLVIGLSQIVYQDLYNVSPKDKFTPLDGATIKKIDYLLANNLYSDLKNELIVLFETWEKEQHPQLWVEIALRNIINRVIKQSKTITESNFDIEFQLDEALCLSSTFGELMANIWDIISRLINKNEVRNSKVDTPDFFDLIDRYLNENLSEQHTLQSVCGIFGISQTYLSRLFRKYRNVSFNEYVTLLRIEKAKKLIAENTNMPIKEISEAVGYKDPFYFSKVFRNITGMPPSQYT